MALSAQHAFQPKNTTTNKRAVAESYSENKHGKKKSEVAQVKASGSKSGKKKKNQGRVKEPKTEAQKGKEKMNDVPNTRSTIKDDDSFSACVLVMDENHKLSEWIAYHYFTIGLRHLVVAVDPHSKTSPNDVLDRWKSHITITQWTDEDFTSQDLKRKDGDTPVKLVEKHRKRQREFYVGCAKHLRELNRTWTAFYDVDEFLTINGDVVENARAIQSRQKGVKRVIEKLATNQPLPNAKLSWYKHFQQGPCVMLPRALYGTIESRNTVIHSHVPTFIDPKQFETLRWRYRSDPVRGKPNLKTLGKAIIDVSRLKPEEFVASKSAHRPVEICGSVFVRYNIQPVGLYHYLGSWEARALREDARKNRRALKSLQREDVYKKKALKRAGGGPDDVARWWIKGFVAVVGEETAKYLLEEAGLRLDRDNTLMSTNATTSSDSDTDMGDLLNDDLLSLMTNETASSDSDVDLSELLNDDVLLANETVGDDSELEESELMNDDALDNDSELEEDSEALNDDETTADDAVLEQEDETLKDD